jgi:hypothetical protein
MMEYTVLTLSQKPKEGEEGEGGRRAWTLDTALQVYMYQSPSCFSAMTGSGGRRALVEPLKIAEGLLAILHSIQTEKERKALAASIDSKES